MVPNANKVSSYANVYAQAFAHSDGMKQHSCVNSYLSKLTFFAWLHFPSFSPFQRPSWKKLKTILCDTNQLELTHCSGKLNSHERSFRLCIRDLSRSVSATMNWLYSVHLSFDLTSIYNTLFVKIICGCCFFGVAKSDSPNGQKTLHFLQNSSLITETESQRRENSITRMLLVWEFNCTQ